MALDDLLQDVPLTAFMSEHYLKLPFARPGGCLEYLNLAGWPLVRRIAETGTGDWIIGREHERWAESSAPTWPKIQELFAAGYTIGIRKAQGHDSDLNDLAERFRDCLRGDVDVHLYCTPSGRTGFGWHYDTEEVFVMQLSGVKRWRLRKNTVNPWPVPDAMPANLRYEREVTPMLECELHAGDWLYLPSGYWHQTAADDDSISLSVGVRPTTAFDMLDFLSNCSSRRSVGVNESRRRNWRVPIR